MKILITGNLGYVGPGVIREFRTHYPLAQIIGFDIGYFAQVNTHNSLQADCWLDAQYYGDLREFPENLLEDIDTVIHLAAISSDPLGNKFPDITFDINHHCTTKLAKMAKRHGAKRFVFASSCSVYGDGDDSPRSEKDELNPLTHYAKSKIYAERDLKLLANEDFLVTCLRFATACGWSERLRLDLVLNDFVACAVSAGVITILSDGTPWRPLINVKDMARALRWGHERILENGGVFIAVNTGTSKWNYQVQELATAVKEIMLDVKISINQEAKPNKQSYQVSFDLFEKLAPNHKPLYDLQASILELINGLREIKFRDPDFRKSYFMHYNIVSKILDDERLDNNLRLVLPNEVNEKTT